MKTSTQTNDFNKPNPEQVPFSPPPSHKKGVKVSTRGNQEAFPMPFISRSLKFCDGLISRLIAEVTRG